MELSNFDKWRFYCDGLVSPDCFIDWGYIFLISAALQRRVWCGPSHQELFPNQYTIFVADPGVGKGLVTRQVHKFLKFHKLNPKKEQDDRKKEADTEEQASAAAIETLNYETAIEHMQKGGKNKLELPPVIGTGADATTYEGLVNALAAGWRCINYSEFDPRVGKNVRRTYGHSSMAFCLEELGSLFRKRAEEVHRLLLQTYDCGDYIYDTKTPGLKDSIQKSCVSLLAGTQPDHMTELFTDRLMTNGFTSRCFFIFAAKNRKTLFTIPPLNHEQVKCYEDILAHIKKLTCLYGNVTWDMETSLFLQNWWERSQYERPNTSYKLDHYYARKQIHLQKIAMALHFSESTDMVIQKQTFERALEILAKEEKKMHYALGIDSNNPLAAPMNKIYKYLKMQAEPKTWKELLTEFFSVLPAKPSVKEALQVILEHLTLTGKIIRADLKTEAGTTLMRWTTVKEEGTKGISEIKDLD